MKSVNRLVSDYCKVHCGYLWSAEGKGGALTTPSTCNMEVFLALVLLFVLWQFRQELWQKGWV